MTLQLKENERQFIKTTIKNKLPQATIYLFGSRVKGTAKTYSDLDVAIIADKPIPLSILSSLNESFAESNLPFFVDLVDWQRISQEFRIHIDQDKIPL